MSAALHLPRGVLERTFEHFRTCGRGLRECRVLWVASRDAPETITDAVHPKHAAHVGGFDLDNHWLNDFWFRLAAENMRIRVQVHTHPGPAFHSKADDDFPIIHKPGFLSLVIPNFALGPFGFANAYLAEIQPDGAWQEISVSSRLMLK